MPVVTLNDAVMSALSAFTGTSNDRQRQWLLSMLAVTPSTYATLDDLWGLFVYQEGFTSGTLQENICAYMKSVIGGSPVGTYNDIELQFWSGTLPPDEDFRLTEEGDPRITEDGAFRELG